MKDILLASLIAAALLFPSLAAAEAQWFKGATHVHSLWSDGDAAPELVADWYKARGWDFVCFSEHNILMEGEKYVTVDEPEGHLSSARLLALQERFGASWPDLREVEGARQMRLKTLAELSAHFNEAGRFLLVPAEEISTQGGNPHANVLNVRELIPGAPEAGDIGPKLQGYIDAVDAQRAKRSVPMLVHLNHPNWKNPIATETMIAARGLHFFEVFNGADVTDPGIPEEGVPSTERRWDVILSMKLRRDPDYLLYGVATDDGHHYHEFNREAYNPGRGWVMVRAERLEAGALIEAMQRGDFYGSSGVTLAAIERGDKHLGVTIAPEPGVNYTTRYIGTRRGFDTAGAADGPLIDSPAIGEVLYETSELSSRYTFSGDELYVRAMVVSDKPVFHAMLDSDVATAWVQPVLVRPF